MIDILITLFWCYIGAGSAIALITLSNGSLQNVAEREQTSLLFGTIVVILTWPGALYGFIQELKRRL